MIQSKEQIIKKLDSYLDTVKKEDFTSLKIFVDKVEFLKKKMKEGEVIIPLVGEFSSGKSSLINAVLEQKVLPVDITPTTFLVNEVRFSCDRDYVEIFYDSQKEVKEGLIDLNKLDYSKATLVKVYSASKKIPRNITLVDIPGLSSIINQHDEIIMKYVPDADAIFVVIDVNQGALTQSTVNFLENAKSLNKDIFVILTKVDTKTEKEVKGVKEYIEKQFEFVNSVITTSAKDRKLDEFYALIDNVKEMADEILIKRVSERFKNICNESIRLLEEQLKNSTLDISEIEKKIVETRNVIENLEREFDRIIYNYKEDIEEAVSLAENKLYRVLKGNLDLLTNAYFGDKGNFENKFKSTIEQAQETALKLFQKEIELRTKKFQEDVKLLIPEPGVSGIPLYILDGISELISIILLDIFLPGGVIPALIGKFVLKILAKIPKIEPYVESIQKFISKIVKIVGRIVAKSYIKSEINKAIDEVTIIFKNELGESADLFFREIESKLTKEFEESASVYNENLKRLLEEKKGETLRFNEYIANLKNSVLQLKGICS